jgi:hypothetical protein
MMNHPYKIQKTMEEIEDAGIVEIILEHVDNLQEVERRLEGINNPHKKREILENMPDVYHIKRHEGLHDGFRRAMYHMDEYQDLHERRTSNQSQKDRGED